jgi:CheY-like chemotaxis protein
VIRILLVEDNAVNRRVLGAMLRAGGFEMDEAEGGEAGLRMLDQADYDLVMMDLRMPGMDGLEAIRHIRARADAKAGVPIILITADAGSDVEADGKAAGADDLVLKPVSMAALFSAIGGLIAHGDEAAVALG